MSDLVVLDFDGVGTADEVLTKLRSLQKEHLIDLEDACVVVHTEAGKVQVKQAVNLTTLGAASGASTGMLIGALAGLLLLNPLAGMAAGGLAGAGFGALSGSLADYGINDEFIKNLGKTIPKGSSALFMLIKRSTPDKVLPEIEPFKPRVIKTSLSREQEDKLRAALSTSGEGCLRAISKKWGGESCRGPGTSVRIHMRGNGWVRAGVGVIATVAIFAALHFASSVLAPVAYALFIIAIVWPMQSRLQSRLPKLLALAIVILAVVVVFVVFASLVAWSFGRVGRWLVSDAARLQLLYGQATAWLDAHGIGVAALWAEHFNVRWLVRAVQEIAGRLNTTVGFWLVVLVYVILGLLEVDDAGRRIRAMQNREAARVLLEGSVTSAAKFRRYLLIRTQMSVATGVLVWALASVTGLQFAAEWGVIAFALNYIPFIGPFIATMFPTLFALAQFASWQAALACSPA